MLSHMGVLSPTRSEWNLKKGNVSFDIFWLTFCLTFFLPQNSLRIRIVYKGVVG
jgi:hypothetical protein